MFMSRIESFNMGIGERIPCAVYTLQLSIGKGLDIAKILIKVLACGTVRTTEVQQNLFQC